MEGRLPVIVWLGVLISVSLSGCLGSGGNPAPTGDDRLSEDGNDSIDDMTNNSTVKVTNRTEFDPDSTVHVHDLWKGRKKVEIVDESVTLDWPQWVEDCPSRVSCTDTPAFVVDVPVDAEDPRYVYPGTGSLEAILTWDSQGFDDAASGLAPMVCVTNRAYLPNCQTDDLSTNTTHVYGTSGETWTIDDPDVVNRHTMDPPHTLKSNWRFAVYPCNSGEGNGDCYPPNVGMTSFTLEVTIQRGERDLPRDPPHFAFYQDRTELDILEDHQVGSGTYKSTHQSWMARQEDESPSPLWRVAGPQIRLAFHQGSSDQPVIPIETWKVEAVLEWSSEDQTQLGLGYRTAADGWQAPWTRPEDPGSCGSGCLRYVMPVGDSETDSPYAHQTQWGFGVFHTDDQPRPLRNYDVTLSIRAFRKGGSV